MEFNGTVLISEMKISGNAYEFRELKDNDKIARRCAEIMDNSLLESHNPTIQAYAETSDKGSFVRNLNAGNKATIASSEVITYILTVNGIIVAVTNVGALGGHNMDFDLFMKILEKHGIKDFFGNNAFDNKVIDPWIAFQKNLQWFSEECSNAKLNTSYQCLLSVDPAHGHKGYGGIISKIILDYLKKSGRDLYVFDLSSPAVRGMIKKMDGNFKVIAEQSCNDYLENTGKESYNNLTRGAIALSEEGKVFLANLDQK